MIVGLDWETGEQVADIHLPNTFKLNTVGQFVLPLRDDLILVSGGFGPVLLRPAQLTDPRSEPRHRLEGADPGIESAGHRGQAVSDGPQVGAGADERGDVPPAAMLERGIGSHLDHESGWTRTTATSLPPQ